MHIIKRADHLKSVRYISAINGVRYLTCPKTASYNNYKKRKAISVQTILQITKKHVKT